MFKALLEAETKEGWKKLQAAIKELDPSVQVKLAGADLTAKPPIKEQHLVVTFKGQVYKVLNYSISGFNATLEHVKNFMKNA